MQSLAECAAVILCQIKTVICDMEFGSDSTFLVSGSPSNASQLESIVNVVSVSQFLECIDILSCPPAWMTNKPGGAEFADTLLEANK